MKKAANFSKEVFKIVARIPRGRVMSYGRIAEIIGKRGAARAVGNVLHKNQDPIKIPCHRVVSLNGGLAKNFGMGGQGAQKARLESEGVKFQSDMVPQEYFFNP